MWQWSYSHFFVVCGFGSSDSLTFILLLIVSTSTVLFSEHMCNYVWLETIWFLICTICTVRYVCLILSQLKNWIQFCSRQWKEKMWKEWLQFFLFFFFFLWRTVSFKEWPGIHHKNINHSFPPNSAVITKSASSSEAIGKTLSYLFFVRIISSVGEVKLLDQHLGTAERHGVGEHWGGHGTRNLHLCQY